ncbi:MAG TPA: hypothetical protein PKX15_04725 [Bacteroidales bacterium]|jgi:hypothetical protein|nr:hypothetical protein [Bacteroidales bacterium]
MNYPENTNYSTNEQQQQENKRPTFLTVLCVLTFIGSGFSFLSQIISFALYSKIPDLFYQMSNIMGGEIGELYIKTAELFVNMPRYYFLILAAVYVISIIGAFLMLLLRKIGFHLYTISQILYLGLPLLIIHSPFNVPNLLLSMIFVLFYARYLKLMK